MLYAKPRAKFAQTLISIHKIMRDTYLPGATLEEYLDHFPIVSAVFIEHAWGRPATAATVAKLAEVPRTTALRRLERLIRQGYVERRGRLYYMTEKINKPGMARRLARVVRLLSALTRISEDITKLDRI